MRRSVLAPERGVTLFDTGATFYKWKAKFGGLDVSDARRLKAIEYENGKLKKLLAETMGRFYLRAAVLSALGVIGTYE